MVKKIISNTWFIGISCSIIASIIYSLGQDFIIIPYLNSFLKLEIGLKLWQLTFIPVILICLYAAIKLIFNLDKKFINYKTDNWAQINWVWDWKKNSVSRKYRITNLNMLCPNCQNGFFTVATMYSQEYKCVKCDFSIPSRSFNKPSFDQIRDEIYNEIRKNYPNETRFIEHD